MDKNTIIGLVLIGALLVGFTWLNKPRPNPNVNQSKTEISTNNQSTTSGENTTTTPVTADTTQHTTAKDSITLPPYAQPQAPIVVTLKNSLLTVGISNKGGMPSLAILSKYKDDDKKLVKLFDKPGDITVNLPLRTNKNTIINTKDCYFTPMSVTDSSVVMRMQISDNSYLDISYTLPKNDYRLKVTLSGKNLASILPENMSLQDIEWTQKMIQQEQSWKFEAQYTGIYYHYIEGDVDRLNINKSETENLSARANWIGFKNKYFSSVLICDKSGFESNTITVHPLKEGSGYIGTCNFKGTFGFDIRNNDAVHFTWFLGPNDYTLLSLYSTTTIPGKNLKLDHLVYLGLSIFRAINKYLIIPIVVFLNKFISNWGIIILLLTLIIKLILSPLTYKSYLSQAKMRVLKPEVEEINKKYPGKDRETMMKRQQETMKLYKAAGASPMSGCLPMLLQAPFFIALYMYFPTSILIRGQSFLWAKDLSTYDPIVSWHTHIPIISDLLGNHISLFCLLMTITNIIYNKFMMNQSSTGQEGMPSMKLMPYLMAIFFFFIFNQNASGLCYYYFISSLITILQYLAFRYTINEKKLLKQMAENKKKPQKKSGWMQRLEEAQRKQMEMQKKRKK